LTELNKNNFSEKLQIWYKTHARNLPWRQTDNAYKIWLSEIILQQTRVAQGMPYYMRFVEQYPTVSDFALAHPDEVLRLWQGLGYYSRARNMHTTAKIVHNELNGQFPDNYKDLLKLKGIGTYTAAAMASFAHNEAVAVLDGNVFRVLARVFGIETDISSSIGKNIFSNLANELLPTHNSATHNQAIMEFGALHCTPKAPLCNTCPLSEICVAFKDKTQALLPVKLKKLSISKRYFYYVIIEFEGRYFLKKRELKGIWQGLFDFLLIETEEKSEIEDILTNITLLPLLEGASIVQISDEQIHILTHQKLHIRFIHLKLYTDSFFKENEKYFYNEHEMEALPKPIVLANFIRQMIIN
jgi:A/G-specific adenine glycosylase